MISVTPPINPHNNPAGAGFDKKDGSVTIYFLEVINRILYKLH